ncbi:hypothetical protein [Sphingomonas canadensis]|nr:hypothetical protein [Sphingomonas canadensis]
MLGLLLSGCGPAPLARPYADQAPPAAEIEAASIDVSGCGGGKGFEIESLGDELAGLAVDTVVKLGKAFLEDAQRKRNAVWSAVGVMQSCFPKQKGGEQSGMLHVRRAVLDGDGVVIGMPGFDLEGRIRFKRTREDGEAKIAVYFQATRLVYGRTAAPSRGRGRKHVVLLIGLTDNAVLGAKPAEGDETVPAPLRIDLGWIQDGYSYSAAQLAHVKAAAVIDAPAVDRFLLTAIVLETEDEMLALKALTEAYGDHEDGLSAALKKAIGVKKD